MAGRSSAKSSSTFCATSLPWLWTAPEQASAAFASVPPRSAWLQVQLLHLSRRWFCIRLRRGQVGILSCLVCQVCGCYRQACVSPLGALGGFCYWRLQCVAFFDLFFCFAFFSCSTGEVLCYCFFCRRILPFVCLMVGFAAGFARYRESIR